MQRNRFFSIVINLIALLVLANLLWWLRPVLSCIAEWTGEILLPFLIGLLVAYLLHPVVTALEKRKVPRSVAVLLIYTSFILTLVVILINAIPVFTRQLIELSDDLPRLSNWYHTWMTEWEYHKYILPDTIQSGVDRVIIQSKERMAQGISDLVENARETISKLLGYAVIPFIAFYFLKDMKLIQRALMQIIPRAYRRKTIVTLRDVNDVLAKYLHGQMVVALIVGGLAYVGYWLIDMPYPFVLAAVVCLTNVIPYIGPLIGATPAAVVALTISTKTVILVLVINLVIQVIEGNILSPNIVGRSLKLHPLLIILALLAGEALGGIVGLIIAVPALAVLKVLISRIVLILRES
ncbi:AI-2E family transporter [Brevibacillus humidisoli]|uniref:AI-2E family transporter n=1 Tax=Brevibacillus humidisoli TaxID=2895522 RepID=UPI001E2FFD46|nr:AI-2E family transporter [Brevibacillus humidisoli]UFJ38980.1 AI-2E family transporter [Brevibacillus humidisoli]